MSEKPSKPATDKHLEPHPKPAKEQPLEEVRELPPMTRALYGLLKNADVDEKDYKAYLLKKYR